MLTISAFFHPIYADTTYEGTDGVLNQVFEAHCTSCHTQGGQFPALDDYDDASLFITEILDRINRNQGASGMMPKGGTKLNQNLLDLVAAWNDDATPEISPPALLVTGHTSLSDIGENLEGTLKENGIETNIFFKYWQGAIEPTSCPTNNTIFNGCTAITTATGSGGADIEEPVVAAANGLNCGTSYTYRMISNQAQNSPNTLTLITTDSGFDADNDGVCDAVDNCLSEINIDQLNTDNDMEGDECDVDDDGDLVNDNVDNCPLIYNPIMPNGTQEDVCGLSQLCFPIQNDTGSVSIVCL